MMVALFKGWQASSQRKSCVVRGIMYHGSKLNLGLWSNRLHCVGYVSKEYEGYTRLSFITPTKKISLYKSVIVQKAQFRIWEQQITSVLLCLKKD